MASNNTLKDQVILGVDPGTNVMGYGIIKISGNTFYLLQYGVIHLNKYNDHALKLKKIFERIDQLLEEFLPDQFAIEAPFFGKNVQSMLKLGRAQGVALAAALAREIPVVEYAPRKVKQSITGNGNASKEQIASMLYKILKTNGQPDLHDATDALAVALCHHFQNSGVARKGGKSWKAFINENPDRIQ